MRIMGIDYGTKRIGIAISDESCTIASPVSTIEYSAEGGSAYGGKDLNYALNELEKVIKTYQISQIIVGLPLNLKGGQSIFTKQVGSFIELLRARVNIPVDIYDERFTSSAAERFLIQADVRRNKRKKLRDRLASQIILQDYLERYKCIKPLH